MDPRKISVGAHLYRLSTLGITVAFCIFLGLGLGVLARKYLGGGDGAVLIGILVGVLAGFYQMVHELSLVKKDDEKK
jgi:hypothetical protein